jgi:ABC-type transport system substrate-binding protein
MSVRRFRLAVLGVFLAAVVAGCGSSKSSSSSSSSSSSTPASTSSATSTSSIETSTASNTATTGNGQYPAQIRTAFLNACEKNAPAAKCECALSNIEKRVPLRQFALYAQQIQQGQPVPAPIRAAIVACR